MKKKDNNKKKKCVKKLPLILLVIFAVILLVLGGFWFYCRVINKRSFMAGLTDMVLKASHRSDKFLYLDKAEEYIAGKAETNKEPVVIEKAKFGVSLREERLGALQAFIYNDQEHPAQTVFYYHGGAYINQPLTQQLTMAARTAKETGCEVVLMVYPKLPVYDCQTAYELCISFYRSYIEANDCGKIVFMGDSAGGGLALGLAEVLRDQGDRCPEELILISPWVDVTMSNTEMPAYLEHDPMLGIDGLRRMGEVWANGLDMKDPRVSPLYGEFKGLGHVTLTVGTWEVLYPDIKLLADRLEEADVDCTTVVGDRMIHCYPICPVPEAKDALKEIWAAIVACSQGTPDDRKDPEGGNRPGEAGNMQIGNPWVDCETLADAAKVAGFDIAIPGKFEGFSNKVYQAIEKTMIQVFYYDGDPEAETSSRITVRKGTGSEDISGDYNEYSEKETLEIHGIDVLVKGEQGKVYCATWTKDGYSFAIVADKGLTKEALSNAIEEMIAVVG